MGRLTAPLALVWVTLLAGCAREDALDQGDFFCVDDTECISGWYCGEGRCVRGTPPPRPDADTGQEDLGVEPPVDAVLPDDEGIPDDGIPDGGIPDDGVPCAGDTFCQPGQVCRENLNGQAVCLPPGAPLLAIDFAGFDPEQGLVAFSFRAQDDNPLPDAFIELAVRDGDQVFPFFREELWPLNDFNRWEENLVDGIVVRSWDTLVGLDPDVFEITVFDSDNNAVLQTRPPEPITGVGVGGVCSPRTLLRPCVEYGWCRPIFDLGEIAGGLCLPPADEDACLIPEGSALIPEISLDPGSEEPETWSIDTREGPRLALANGACALDNNRLPQEGVTRFTATEGATYIFTVIAEPDLNENGEIVPDKVPVLYARWGCMGDLPVEAGVEPQELGCVVAEIQEDGVVGARLTLDLFAGETIYLYLDGQFGWTGEAELAVERVRREPVGIGWFNDVDNVLGFEAQGENWGSPVLFVELGPWFGEQPLFDDPVLDGLFIPVPHLELASELHDWFVVKGALPLPLDQVQPMMEPFRDLAVTVYFEDLAAPPITNRIEAAPNPRPPISELGDLCDPLSGWSACDAPQVCVPVEADTDLSGVHVCAQQAARCPPGRVSEIIGDALEVEPAPMPFNARVWQIDGDTRVTLNRQISQCDTSWVPFATDATYSFVAPEDGRYLFRLLEDSFEGHVYWSPRCDVVSRVDADFLPDNDAGRQCLTEAEIFEEDELPRAYPWAELRGGDEIYITVDNEGLTAEDLAEDDFEFESGRFTLEVRQASSPRIADVFVRYNPDANSMFIRVWGTDPDQDVVEIDLRLFGEAGVLPLGLLEGRPDDTELRQPVQSIINAEDGLSFSLDHWLPLPQAFRPVIWDEANGRLTFSVEVTLVDSAGQSSTPSDQLLTAYELTPLHDEATGCDLLQTLNRCDAARRCDVIDILEDELITACIDPQPGCPDDWPAGVVITVDPDEGLPIADGTQWVVRRPLNDQWPHNLPATCQADEAGFVLDLSALPQGLYEVRASGVPGLTFSASARTACRYPSRIYPQDEIDCDDDINGVRALNFALGGEGPAYVFLSASEPRGEDEVQITIRQRVPVGDR
ncbi:MAG: hypothetical protein ACE366_20545 [Bradymonadia bacterium]